MASRHVRDVPPRPRTFYSSVFHRISYSWHEVTYLSGRKRFRGCTIVVKKFECDSAGEKWVVRVLSIRKRCSVELCGNILSFLLTRNSLRAAWTKSYFVSVV